MFPGIDRNNEESLPKWITSSYNKDESTFETITQQLGATLVTNNEIVVVGGFYLAKMPWYKGNYAVTISGMIEKAKKEPEIMAKMTENIKISEDYEGKYDSIKNEYDKRYLYCLFEGDEGDVAHYESLQKLLDEPGSKGYDAGVEQGKLYQKHAANEEKCQHFITERNAALDKLTETAPHGFTQVEQLYDHLKKLQNIPLLFIEVLGIQDGMIRCHGYDVKTGKIYSTINERKFNVSSDVDVFFMRFRDVELYSIDKQVIEAAREKFDKIFLKKLKDAGTLGGKRRSKTNGRFRKYRSRRNISSRTQRRKKTQRRQRR